MFPVFRDFQICKNALNLNRLSVLVVPAYAVGRANLLRHRRSAYSEVPIFTFEGVIAGCLVLEAARRGCTMPEMWQTIISEYNHSAYDGLRPKIMLKWE